MPGAMVLTCPVTGKEYSTGINVDKSSFEMLPNPVTRSRCPHCGHKHAWHIKDAKWVQNTPPSKWVENLMKA